jgi:hypothetical protein
MVRPAPPGRNAARRRRAGRGQSRSGAATNVETRTPADQHPKEILMRAARRAAIALAVIALMLVAWQVAASAATAIEYGLIAA